MTLASDGGKLAVEVEWLSSDCSSRGATHAECASGCCRGTVTGTGRFSLNFEHRQLSVEVDVETPPCRLLSLGVKLGGSAKPTNKTAKVRCKVAQEMNV